MSGRAFYSLVSDLILVVHFAFVSFILLGFVMIWTGYFLKWPFIYNLRFRMMHLLAMGFVFLEAMIGMVCPLTEWENALRIRAGEGGMYEESFIEHWLGKVLYYELPERFFTIAYAVFFFLLLATFVFIPPRRNKRN